MEHLYEFSALDTGLTHPCSLFPRRMKIPEANLCGTCVEHEFNMSDVMWFAWSDHRFLEPVYWLVNVCHHLWRSHICSRKDIDIFSPSSEKVEPLFNFKRRQLWTAPWVPAWISHVRISERISMFQREDSRLLRSMLLLSLIDTRVVDVHSWTLILIFWIVEGIMLL